MLIKWKKMPRAYLRIRQNAQKKTIKKPKSK